MKSARWTSLLTHPLLALAFRLYLGGLFNYASLYKINYTAEFAETIASYQMVPYWGENLMAVILPSIELICGILLIIGIRTRTVAAVVGFLLLLFTVGIVAAGPGAIPGGLPRGNSRGLDALSLSQLRSRQRGHYGESKGERLTMLSQRQDRWISPRTPTGVLLCVELYALTAKADESESLACAPRHGVELAQQSYREEG